MKFLAKWGPHAARVLLGLVFFVFGLNYFLNFLPPQPMSQEKALAFLGGIQATGYLFPLMKVIEVTAGLALLSNRFVPLALVLLAPIIVNIAAFHFVLAPAYAMPTVIVLLTLYLAWHHRATFAPILRARASAEEAKLGHTVLPTAQARG